MNGAKTDGNTHPLIFAFAAFAFVALVFQTHAFAQTEPAESDFTVVKGDALQNDPVASQILRNIEIARERMAQMQEAQEQRTAHQQYVDEQRRLAQERLERDLENMNRNNEDYTPRNAFATFLAGTNSTHHAIYWSQFDYMAERVRLANEAKDAVLQNGGTSAEAHREFIKYASMSRSEMVSFISELNIQHGFSNHDLQSHFDADGKLTRYGSDELEICYSCEQYEEMKERMLTEHEMAKGRTAGS